MNSFRRYAPPHSKREAIKVPIFKGMSASWKGNYIDLEMKSNIR
jgi:hypothetical protein